jgi:hypothetical protein
VSFDHLWWLVRSAGRKLREDPTDLPRIPAWNRVTSALPDFLERLSTTVTEENRKADQAIMAEEHREAPVEIPADVQAKKPTLKTS